MAPSLISVKLAVCSRRFGQSEDDMGKGGTIADMTAHLFTNLLSLSYRSDQCNHLDSVFGHKYHLPLTLRERPPQTLLLVHCRCAVYAHGARV